MKYTLLEMVQKILRSIEGDEVNAYNDTTESSDVADIIRETYYHLAPKLDLPIQHNFYQLVASGDSNKPVLMTFPTDAIDADWIQYSSTNAASDVVWDYVDFVEKEQFVQQTFTLSESSSNVSTMTVDLDGTNFTFKYHTDRKPTFYTTIDDNNIIFNAHDSSVDSTLAAAKTLVYGKKVPSFTMADSFTPNLSPEQFDYLLNEARTQAFVELKQADNPLSRKRAMDGYSHIQRTKHNLPNRTNQNRQNYGRKTQ